MRKDNGEISPSGFEHAAEIAPRRLLRLRIHFSDPGDLLSAPGHTHVDKQASLASWAPDRFVVESVAAQRWLPGSPRPLSYDEVMSGRKSLDGDMKPKSARQCAAPDRPQSHHALAGMFHADSADAMLCRHNHQYEKGDSACQPP
ncbi:hypothetical protein RGR602_PC01992 (plasmid) [Rhizobium gallicum bv. gallicum R602sp]|uniref:Uncharacterized protein n=1 Tax=Rhizobium gallicum bv. gallicum R602sp TaxID=1041138 RepID=A0A0B4XH18_9HYPH|nr:hypothetical protein [Rhizobium gallicum]AJD46015.1 hypothetical protein RGR602_PC01992 [Rhizobium gallicum bv. gallicum R602sp]